MNESQTELQKVVTVANTAHRITFPAVSAINNMMLDSISESLSGILDAYQKVVESQTLEIARCVSELVQTAYKPFFDINAVISQTLAETLERAYKLADFPSYQNLISSIDFDQLSSALSNVSETSADDDYVTLDSAPIKEWNVPETVAIPVGSGRIRMKTSDFIAILLVIIPLVFGILPFNEQEDDSPDIYFQPQITVITEDNDDPSSTNYEPVQELVQSLYDLVTSADISSSSQADLLEDIKEISQDLYSEVFTSEELSQQTSTPPAAADSAPSAEDSVPDNHSPSPCSTSEYSCTEFEN